MGATPLFGFPFPEVGDEAKAFSDLAGPGAFEDLAAAVEAALQPEAWHIVDTAGEPAYAAGAATVGAPYAPQTPAQFYRHLGVVRVHGRVAIAGGTGAIFTLPVGYRPLDRLTFVVADLTGPGGIRVTVAANGVVSQVDSSAAIALDEIAFRAEQ